MNFFKFLMYDVLSVPAVLVGLVALIGLLAQKKSSTDCLKGTIKTIMGFIILGAGAGVVVGSLGHFANMFQHGFGINGIVPNNEAIVSIAQKTFGKEMALIMFFGMIVNIIIARFTKWKYIFLTGHHTLYMGIMIAAILAAGGMTGVSLVAVGSIILGLVMVVFPAMAQKFMVEITGVEDVAFGHFGTVGYVLAGYVGKWFGNKEESTEEMTLPNSLSFLRDTPVAIATTMALIFLISSIVAGKSYVEEISGGQHFIVFALIQAITFAGGVFVILQGVRMILAEIIPAFKGIAEKLVPDAKPALDCPVVFPYAPTAVLIGFLSSFAAGIVGMFLCMAFNLPVIIPGVVPHFFCGATAGVFGNATGGKRGAIIGAFAHGLLITILPILLMPVLGDLGYANTTFSDTDFGVVGILLGNVLRLFVH
ncbi:PTS ascorbate transporter subunit IIC [Anaeromicrobium sediminis]|uniref:Ascorbate-specific PTS system EIIC component n=1 Tax=Anaeromicrobium sediminis TaxID=1478221 RepID=A0A267MN69_9FIRM|nr:PTS ascorbate transporter subunit IIC [Anaeromicrobium sediminis]PAB61029.1 PTS ascorbate transporter subunit IIC [Anaeromicrobium sediminis]